MVPQFNVYVYFIIICCTNNKTFNGNNKKKTPGSLKQEVEPTFLCTHLSERMIETATGIVHLTCIVTCSANRHT